MTARKRLNLELDVAVHDQLGSIVERGNYPNRTAALIKAIDLLDIATAGGKRVVLISDLDGTRLGAVGV